MLGKISSYPTYPIAVILKMAMHLEDPERTASTPTVFALIGRDVLEHCTLFYNGPRRELTLSLSAAIVPDPGRSRTK